MSRAVHILSAHWYAPIFIAMVVSVWLLARAPTFMASGGEAALLADLCLTAPVLYAMCYGRRQELRTTAVRALAIACAGIWLASWLIPEERQSILPQLTPLRWIGLALLAVFEVRLIYKTIRMAFSGTATPKQLADASDAPEWIARLVLLEARFWRSIWRMIGGRDKPKS